MRRLLKSEVLKLRSTPTMWWLLAGMVLLTVVACVGAFALQEAAQVARTSDIALRSDLHAIGSGSIFVAVAGMIGMAGEFRFGQADQTYISTPRRSRVLRRQGRQAVARRLRMGDGADLRHQDQERRSRRR